MSAQGKAPVRPRGRMKNPGPHQLRTGAGHGIG
jgi:hypothetical protein